MELGGHSGSSERAITQGCMCILTPKDPAFPVALIKYLETFYFYSIFAYG
jgi:hypothetical protein